MRLHIIILALFCLPVAANAQHDRTIVRSNAPMRFVPGSALLSTNPATGMAWQAEGSPFANEPQEMIAPAQASNFNNHYNNNNYKETADSTKQIGELHGSVGLSVMGGFGKHAPKGAGFAQNIDLNYTVPLGKHVWLTAGGYLNHLNWDGINITNGGLYGELGYQFDEHWAAYIYGQKSLANSGMCGYPYYYGYYDGFGYPGYYGSFGYPGYNPFGDKIGAAIRWTPNKNFSLQLSVERTWYPKPDFSYNRWHDYQK